MKTAIRAYVDNFFVICPTGIIRIKGMTLMKAAIRAYVDDLFKDAPVTGPVAELREEVLSDLEARYDDCITGGMTPQRAYTAVISTVGNIAPLISRVSGEGVHEKGLFEKASPRRRLERKYAYIFKPDNLKAIKSAVIAVMWLLLTAFYVAFSVSTQEWSWTWLIFLIGAALNVTIEMIGDIAVISRRGDDSGTRVRLLKKIRGSASAIMWLAAVFMYFLITGITRAWEVTWIIFLIAAAVQIIINTVFKVQISRFRP